MKRHMQLLFGLAAVLLLLAGTPRPARADGGVFPPLTARDIDVEMPAQKAILVWDEEKGHEDLILSVELLGGPEAAWVVPVPSLPEVRAASPGWFEHLSDLTKPRIEEVVEYVTILTVEVEKEVGGGVELISREKVGVYDVSILSADETGALLDWLDENGYAFPKEGRGALYAYVEEGGWYFVAARVLPGDGAYLQGDVHPLWFSFDAEQPVYPMRLTSLFRHRVHVLIYVLTDHRVETGYKFETEFAGELTLRPQFEEDADLVDLLTQRPYYVTKLRRSVYAPGLVSDLHFERAATDEPYRKVIYHTKYVYRPATEPPPTKVASEHAASEAPTERSAGQLLGGSGLLVLGVGLVLLVLLAGVALAWQRSRPKADEG